MSRNGQVPRADRIVTIYCNARPGKTHGGWTVALRNAVVWRCNRCGGQVKVVA